VRTKTRILLALWLGLGASPAFAGDASPEFGPDSHEQFVERVNGAQSTDYHAVLSLYDEHRRADPDDVISLIERCRFIENFAYSEDGAIASAGDDLDACRAQLRVDTHKDDAEVILYGAETANWDDKGMDAAKALIPDSRSWTLLQQSRLYENLARRSQFNDEAMGGGYAIAAVELNPASPVFVQALTRWKQLGAKAKVRRAISAAPDSIWERVPRTQVAEILIEMGDADAAAELLNKTVHVKYDYGTDLTMARALAAKGSFKEAEVWFRKAFASNKYVDIRARIEYFEFEVAHGSEKAAIAAYDEMRKAQSNVDAIGRYRMSLIAAHPHLIWDSKTIPAMLAILAMALVLCLVPLIVIVPIHYRGLARRVRGNAPEVLPGAWKLRHAWYAFAMFLLASNAVIYIFAPSFLNALMPWAKYTQLTPTSDLMLAKMLLWSTILTIPLLAPLLRGQDWKSILLGRWSVKRSIFVGLSLAILLKIVSAMFGMGMKSAGALGSDTMRSIQGANEAYGLMGMLLLIGVLTPIIEEFVFRGVLLKAFRGQVSFVLATLVQALAFTLLHEEREVMIILFAFALILGWLVKRSEGLLAPIVMHCTNNLTAGLAIVGMTNMLNR